MIKENFLKTRKIVGVFAVLSLLGGMIFASKTITGSASMSSFAQFKIISLLGLVLIICAGILGAYAVSKS